MQKKLKKKYSKKISIWLCTNGSLLNKEICSFLDKHNVSIGVSLDGNKINHDKCRIDKNGKGTYDIVVSKIKKILNSEKYSKKFKNVWGLSVVSKYNSNVCEIVKHNIKLGLKNIQMNLYRGDSSDLRPDEISKSYSLLCEEIFHDFQKGNTEILKSIINDNDYFGKILKRIFLHEVAFRRCLAGISNVTVCPDGDVYPCDSFVGYKEYCIGNYKSLDKIYTDFNNLSVDACEKCKNCSIRYICGGDCYYNSYINNGKTNEPDETFCEIQMCIVNCSIELKKKMEEFNPKGFEEIIRLLKIKQGYNNISQ